MCGNIFMKGERTVNVAFGILALQQSKGIKLAVNDLQIWRNNEIYARELGKRTMTTTSLTIHLQLILQYNTKQIMIYWEATVVHWNEMCSGGRGIPKCRCWNPGPCPRGDWASTRGNGSKMGERSTRRSLLGGLL